MPDNIALASDNNAIKITSVSVNLREGDSTKYDIVGKAYKGEIYKIYGMAENGWYNIRTKDGINAWVSGNHVVEINHTNKDIQSIPLSYIETTGSANIRSGSSSAYKKLGSASKGEVFKILDIDENGWYSIRTKSGVIGWISPNYVKILNYVEVINPILNVRSGPTSAYKKIDEVYEGEIFKILDTSSNGWYKIKTKSGNIGWVSNNLVKETSYKLEDKQSLNLSYVEITGSAPNIREGSSSAYGKIGQAKKGEIYLLQDIGDNGWYKIRTKEGRTGWISGNYAMILKAIRVNNSILNVRSGSSTSYGIIDKVYDGEIYGILGKASNGWYKIRTRSGKVGWVAGTYVEEVTNYQISDFKSLPLTYVEVINPTLNVRSGASSAYKIVDRVYGGEIYVVQGVASNGWYKIKTKNGKLGWISNNLSKKINYLEVINPILNVRKGPSTDYEILGQVEQGQVYMVQDISKDNWYEIRMRNGISGWVSPNHVKVVDPKEGDVISVPFNFIQVKNPSLNVRSGPSSAYNLIAKVYNGEVYLIQDKASNGWYKIKTKDGLTGWVSGNYVEEITIMANDDLEEDFVIEYYTSHYENTFEEMLDAQMKRNNQTDQYGGGFKPAKKEDVKYHMDPMSFLQFKPTGKVNAQNKIRINTASLNVRSIPSAGGEKLTSVSKGQEFSILGQENGWYKIDVNGTIGWVSGAYVVAINNNTSIAQTIKSIKVTTPSLNVREKPDDSSKVLTSVVMDSIYVIIDESGDWYKINTNGLTGWIHRDYTIRYHGVPREMYQFLILTGSSGISLNDLNKELKGKGILEGRGQAFIDASKKYNINELYIMAHTFLETGHGKSMLANGLRLDADDRVITKDGYLIGDRGVILKEKGKEPYSKIAYNMYGIGAVDSDVLRGGIKKAINEGWFTPEAAIIGGIEWIAESYINHPTYKQNTLYKMRWFPQQAGGWHQYATDIGWARKQSNLMGSIMADICEKYNIPLRFDIPKYME